MGGSVGRFIGLVMTRIKELLDGLPSHFCTDIHDPHRMNPNNFGEPPTLRLASSSSNT